MSVPAVTEGTAHGSCLERAVCALDRWRCPAGCRGCIAPGEVLLIVLLVLATNPVALRRAPLRHVASRVDYLARSTAGARSDCGGRRYQPPGAAAGCLLAVALH